MATWSERDKKVVWHPFTQMREWSRDPQLTIVRGDGPYLIDDQGRRYLDGVSSLWCNVHGHNHPRLNQAVRGQLDQLAHSTFLGLSHPPAIELAENLVRVAPSGLTRVFYSDSGSAAVEIALKMAFQYWQLRGTPRPRFLRMEHAYHGDTLGAVGVGGIELFHRIFGPLIVRSIGVPSPTSAIDSGETPEAAMVRSLAALDSAIASHGHEVGALIMEPLVQGAAGMLMHPPGFLRAVADRCRAADILLIVDEVATGFGRTGAMFACEHEDVRPDILCVAKGLTGGYLPLAATLTTDAIYEAFLGERAEYKAFFHGHTFTANPLACAVALESMAMLEESALDWSRDLARYLERLLREFVAPLPFVGQIRQRGLMIGIELARPDRSPFPAEEFRGAKACDAARKYGVILRPLGDVLVWMPPLTLTRDDADLLAHATIRGIEDSCG
ncbi:MAG: adenosylmethionine--8-amino-7-oxononanoate transaminase [Deltaproteobacteria bacterium]|nr:adenosylmethionine--8-amino-7-oxononanoate transaminase [Deltaproteobacteria bacterium]